MDVESISFNIMNYTKKSTIIRSLQPRPKYPDQKSKHKRKVGVRGGQGRKENVSLHLCILN